MKIYQIHEYGGEWEDKYDYIVNSYASENKAKAELEQLEQEEEEYREWSDRCGNCPLFKLFKRKSDIKVDEYCDKYEPFDINKHDPEEYCEDEPCVNYYIHREYCFYRIEEVEVIE